MDNMDKIGQYGQNWTKLDNMDKIGQYGQNWTQMANNENTLWNPHPFQYHPV